MPRTAEDIDFLIIGAAKSATTWLQRALQADPTVSMPDPELHYFSRFYDRGHGWYFDQFPKTQGGELTGEKSNSYLDTPAAAERISLLLPHAKLIVQLRNPVERAYSDYCMLYRRGEVSGDIDAHLGTSNADNRFLAGGCYCEQLQRYRRYFPESQVLVLLFEDMIANPQAQIKQVRDFLGLAKDISQIVLPNKVKDRRDAMVSLRLRTTLKPLKPFLRPFRANAAFAALRSRFASEVTYPPLTAELRGRLVGFYSAEMDRMAELLKRDLSCWRPDNETDTPLGDWAAPADRPKY